MSFSRHTRTRAFSSSRLKTCAVWVRKEPKTKFSFLFVLCFNSFYLKQDSLCLISYLLLESCFHTSASFYHAFIHMHISFHAFMLFVCFCLVIQSLFCLFFKIKREKSEKYKNNMCFVYIGTCVPWMAIETKFFKLCISCSLDEHLYAQLSK